MLESMVDQRTDELIAKSKANQRSSEREMRARRKREQADRKAKRKMGRLQELEARIHKSIDALLEADANRNRVTR
jgi:hypothetical protein